MRTKAYTPKRFSKQDEHILAENISKVTAIYENNKGDIDFAYKFGLKVTIYYALRVIFEHYDIDFKCSKKDADVYKLAQLIDAVDEPDENKKIKEEIINRVKVDNFVNSVFTKWYNR